MAPQLEMSNKLEAPKQPSNGMGSSDGGLCS